MDEQHDLREPTEATSPPAERAGVKGLLVFVGLALLWFALQLWILPACGVST
jgi:hypothetical protein